MTVELDEVGTLFIDLLTSLLKLKKFLNWIWDMPSMIYPYELKQMFLTSQQVSLIRTRLSRYMCMHAMTFNVVK